MPTKHGGKNTGLKNQYGKPIYEEVEDGIYSGNIQPTSTHATERQAVRAAVMRSKNMKHRGRPASESTEKNG